MIVRSALKCLTCEQPHTVRIGMGQEETHVFKFPCRECSEEIVVRLNVDYEKIGCEVVYEENAERISEVPGAPIVNLDANFVIPDSEQGKESFFRLKLLDQRVKVAQKQGSMVSLADVPKDAINSRPYRRPDYENEWRLLKKAWSLSRNGKEKLSRKRIEVASGIFYSNDPLKDLPDWIWRLSLFMSQPMYQPILDDAMNEIYPLSLESSLEDFMKWYGQNLASERSDKYFEIIKAFFNGYAEYAQVYFDVVKGIPISPTQRTTSADFDKVKLFYGKAFECYTSLVEFLALLNNMLVGRAFDEFEQLTLETYRKLDKANRFGPFSMNTSFMALCSEADNQLRNASHHEAFSFDAASQIIRYRVGKGNQGEEKELSYAVYLERCTKLFLQILALLRIELMLCSQYGIKHPL